MKKKRVAKKNVTMFVSTTCLIMLLGFFGYSLFKDWIQIANNQKQLGILDTYYKELLSTEESLNSEVIKLHDEEYVARYARERYMYSLPNETIIKIPSRN